MSRREPALTTSDGTKAPLFITPVKSERVLDIALPNRCVTGCHHYGFLNWPPHAVSGAASCGYARKCVCPRRRKARGRGTRTLTSSQSLIVARSARQDASTTVEDSVWSAKVCVCVSLCSRRAALDSLPHSWSRVGAAKSDGKTSFRLTIEALVICCWSYINGLETLHQMLISANSTAQPRDLAT